MRRIFDHIRDHLHDKAFGRELDLEHLMEMSWSDEFESLMRARLIMGSMRYQSWKEKRRDGDKYNYPGAIADRIQRYIDTGNTEFLVDIANMAMLEFEFGVHPNKHFEAGDDGVHVQLREENE